MSWPKNFEEYQRTPIAISEHSVILIRLYKGNDHFADAWTWDNESHEEWGGMRYQLAAEQFKKQLEGHDCVAFWQAIKEVAEKEIAEWEAHCAQSGQDIRNSHSQEGQPVGTTDE